MSTYHIYQNLLAQVERVFRHSRQGSIQTRRRYKEAVCRFCYFLAEVYRLERLANIAPKHIFAYAEFLKENGKAASTWNSQENRTPNMSGYATCVCADSHRLRLTSGGR